jgi:hypothetical protein
VADGKADEMRFSSLVKLWFHAGELNTQKQTMPPPLPIRANALKQLFPKSAINVEAPIMYVSENPQQLSPN